MTRLIVCDVCQQPITDGPVEFANGDYHDSPACVGAIQAAWTEALAKVKKPAR